VYEAEMKLVKAAVLSQLGLPFQESPTEALIMEIFPAATVVSSVPAPASLPAPTQLPAPGNPGFAPAAAAPPVAAAPGAVRRDKTPSAADLPYWDNLVSELQAGNLVNWWDNRPKKASGAWKPTASDFSQKLPKDAPQEQRDGAKSLWLNTCPDQYMDIFGVTL